MFRGRGRGVTAVVVTTQAPPAAAAHPPPAAAPPSTCAAPPVSCTGPRNHVEYFFHDQFEKVWDDRHTGADPYDGSFFHPIAPVGFFAVGSVAVRGQVDYPHGVRALVVREPAPIPGHAPLIAPPTSFTKIWEDKGTGGRYGDCSLWWPNAPAGYVAIGVVAVKGYNQPHPDLVRCIHVSAIVPAVAHPEADGHFIWCDRKSKAKFGDVSLWALHPAAAGGVATGTFVCANNYSLPNANFFTIAESPRGPVVFQVTVASPATHSATTATVVVAQPAAHAPPCAAPPPVYSAPPPAYAAPPMAYAAPPSSAAPPSTTAAYYPPPSGGGHPPPPSAVPYAQPPPSHTTVVVAAPPPVHHHPATVVVAQPAHHHHHAPPPAHHHHPTTVVVAQPAHHHHTPPTVVVAQPAHHHHAPPAHHDTTVVVTGGRPGILGRGRGTTVVTIDKHR